VHLDDIQIGGCSTAGAVGAKLSTVFDENGLLIYPNPAHDRITLAYNLNNDTNVTTTIADISGRIVYQNPQMRNV